MSVPFIDLKGQYEALKPKIHERIERVLKHGQYIMGPEVAELEDKLAAYTGAKYCVAVASGTEALLISLMALGIKRGDEIITTAFTFVATAEVIVLLGAKPVLVDIEADTCNIDANLVEAKITEKTRAIIPVSLYGQPADMDEINAIAAKYGIPVIEDAAQSFGAEYRGKKSCNLSTVGCTSFFPSKPLGCYGDGGAIFTSDFHLAESFRQIRVHGQSQRYVHTRLGVGGRMDTIQCAILLAKFDAFDGELEQRTNVGNRYNELLDPLGVSRVAQRPNRKTAYGQYTIFAAKRDQVIQKLSAENIPTSVHYPLSLAKQPFYSSFCCAECVPVSIKRSGDVLSLPMYPALTYEAQKSIASLLAENADRGTVMGQTIERN